MDGGQRQTLVDLVSRCLDKIPTSDGWVLGSMLGSTLRTDDPNFSPQAYGVEKLGELLGLISDVVETSVVTSGPAPVLYARLKPHGQSQTALPAAPRPTPRSNRSSTSPRHILDWAYIPDIPGTVDSLRDVALEERWSFVAQANAANQYPILWNYLRYTFFRLKNEKKIREATSVAAFNTGLVDKRYEAIYAFFRPNPNKDRQRWRFSSFCIAGEDHDGKDLVRSFKPKPESAHYFSNIEDMFYDPRAGRPEVDWEHVLIENISRIPLQLLREHAPQGFNFLDTRGMSYGQKEQFFGDLGSHLKEDVRAYRSLKNRFVDALDLAIKRTRWNFKTAIPQYHPRRDEMSLLLPLALVSEEAVDVALVVEKTKSGNYLGHTIFPLDWAYMNARLVCRPDSDWLVPDAIAESDQEEDALDHDELEIT